MNGQWIGKYSGTNTGEIVVNIDDFRSSYRGVAYLNESNASLPGSAALFETSDKESDFKFTAEVVPIHPHTRNIDSWENVKVFYPPNVIVPKSAEVHGTWNNEVLKLSWTTDIGTTGTCELPKSRADEGSQGQVFSLKSLSRSGVTRSGVRSCQLPQPSKGN